MPKRSLGRGVAALHSVRVAAVAAGTYGPYVGTGAGETLLLWGEARSDAGREFFTLPLSDKLVPQGAPRRIAEAPSEMGLVAVKPAGPIASGKAGRAAYVVLSAWPDGAGAQVAALLVSSHGELLHESVSLTRSQGEVLWVDALPTARGSLVLWASKRGDRADVFGAELDEKGARSDGPLELAHDALAWQAALVPNGFALGTVQAGAQHEAGAVKLDLRAGGLHSAPKSIGVVRDPVAELDFDMIEVGGNLVLAWSDRRETESRVYRAVFDARGTPIHPAEPLTEPFGEQALVELVSPFREGEPGYVAWENMSRPSAGPRTLEVARIDASGQLSSERGELIVDAPLGTLPELRAAARGLAALTVAPACQEASECASAERVPTFIEFDSSFAVVASEPIRLDALGGEAPSLAWGLSCAQAGCFALAAQTSSPAPVFAAELRARTSKWQRAASKPAPVSPPRVVAMQAIGALDPLADVSAARVGGNTLSAWVSYFDPSVPWERLKRPAADGRFEPLRARLEVRAVSDTGAALPSQVISLRARSVGGVALAAGDPAQKTALLAWSAEDNKEPQVFLTLLADDGHRLLQKMLTRRNGEISDVAVAFTGDGYLVGWIDERDGDAEVYVAKVDQKLQRVGPERRLTQAKGVASQLALLRLGNEVLCTWADARDPEHPASADVYGMRLQASDASPLSAERRLVETRAHSHSPVLASRGATPILAWIEDALEGEARPGSVRVAELDAQGRVTGTPAVIAVSRGEPLNVALDCTRDTCRAIVALDFGETAELDAIELAEPRKWKRLLGLSAMAAQAVAPVLLGSELFYADLAGQKLGRVRWAKLDW